MIRITEAGQLELKGAKKGLSIWQRRLLLALEMHRRLDVALEADPLLRRPSVTSDLFRLIELGLVVREQPADSTQVKNANTEAVAGDLGQAEPAPTPPDGQHRHLVGIGAAAVCAVAVIGYLVFKPTTKTEKTPEPPVATAPTPIVTAPSTAGAIGESSTKPPRPTQASASPPAGDNQRENTAPVIEKPKAPSTQLADSTTTRARTSAKPSATDAKPKLNAQAKAPQATEARPKDSPAEKPATVAANSAQAVRTEPTLDKSRSCPPPVYPAESLKNGEQGTVRLSFLIDVNGNVAEAKIDASSGHSRLDVAARDMLSKCHFKPGTVGGKPEATWARLRYSWRLE